jgi:hypothetical protein
VFSLAALAGTSADAAALVASAPFKFTLDLATATTVSGEFTP